MKKIAIWTAVIAFIVLIIDWGVVGVQLLDGDYNIQLGVYIAVAAAAILFACIIYVKCTSRCAQCGKMKHVFWKYCPYCGKEIE